MTLPTRTAVIAVGGNALIRAGQRGTIPEQFENARLTAAHVGALVADGDHLEDALAGRTGTHVVAR